MISTEVLKAPYRNNGFTLIEVLISLTIMAVITAIAFSGFSIGMNSWQRGTAQVKKLDERANVERLLRRQLALADPTESRAKIQDKPVVVFRGSANRIDFVSNYSLTDGPCDFRKIGYVFDGHAFRYEEKSLFGYAPAPDETIEGQPVAALNSMQFRYLKKGKDSMNQWQAGWNYGEGLPAAVEVRIEGDVIFVPLVNGL